MTLFQERKRKIAQLTNPLIIHIRPKERLTIHQFLIRIGKILRVNPITDDKDLDIAVKTLIGMLAITINLVKRLLHI